METKIGMKTKTKIHGWSWDGRSSGYITLMVIDDNLVGATLMVYVYRRGVLDEVKTQGRGRWKTKTKTKTTGRRKI
jgi:hypothetical protein